MEKSLEPKPSIGGRGEAHGAPVRPGSGDGEASKRSLNELDEKPKLKRRRIAVACKSCRYRKSRCDGVRPKCSTCQDLGFECQYSAQEPKSFANGINDTLASRLGAVEEALYNLTSRVDEQDDHLTAVFGKIDSLSASQRNLSVDATAAKYRKYEGESLAAAEGLASLSHARMDGTGMSTPQPDAAPPQDMTDGMGAVDFSAEENTGFFGPSSNIAFTRQIVRAVKATLRTQHRPSSGGSRAVQNSPEQVMRSHMLHVSRPTTPLHQRLDNDAWKTDNPVDLSLPPDEECLALINQYFSRSAVLFPYIHEASFIAAYRDFRATGIRKVRRSWLGLLNMILAMAMRTATSFAGGLTAVQRDERSDLFFMRAWRLCEPQVKYAPSLEIVQFELLMAQYLQGTSRGAETWTAHGLTVKAAFALGLHSSDALSRLSPLEREIRKRTFFMCVLLDRTLSMTFGRPFALPASYVRMSPPEGYPDAEAEGISSSTASLGFFNATITLYNSIFTIIDTLYGGNLGCGETSSAFDVTSRLLYIDQDLLAWQRDLPPELAPISPHELKHLPHTFETLPLRFRVILTLRFHNVRILAHRPILVKFLEIIGAPAGETQDLRMLSQLGMESVQACVQSAQNVLELVQYLTGSGEERKKLLGAWWYTLFYSFNASLVIFSALLIRHLSANSNHPITISYPQNPISKATLKTAVSTLSSLDTENRMVEKCSQYTSRLYGILDSLDTPARAESRGDHAASKYDPHQLAAGAVPVLASMPNYASPILNRPSVSEADIGGLDGGWVVPGLAGLEGHELDMSEFLISGDLDLLGQMQGRSFF